MSAPRPARPTNGFPDKPSEVDLIVGNGYAVRVRIDWPAVRRQAQRAIGSKSGRSVAGPVLVRSLESK